MGYSLYRISKFVSACLPSYLPIHLGKDIGPFPMIANLFMSISRPSMNSCPHRCKDIEYIQPSPDGLTYLLTLEDLGLDTMSGAANLLE